jgi:hypothetical protein
MSNISSSARPGVRISLLSGLLVAVVASAEPSVASDVDLLIDKLVERGLLSQEDATQLISEMDQQRASIPEQSLDTPPARPIASGGSWVDRVKLKGDLRVRYQDESLDNAPEDDTILDISERERYRIRWRVGALADVTDNWEVGFGFASGGGDPRSTNQTLNGAFSTKDARLDYAYARYAPGNFFEMLAGKFKNPIWKPKDLLWDSDINPEGFAAPMTFQLSENINAFVTPAFLQITDDVTNSRKAGQMWALQGGVEWAVSDRVDVTFAPALYAFDNLEGTPGPIALSALSNSRDEDGNLIYEYDSVTLGGSVDISDVGRLGGVEVFGEFVNAFDPDDDNTGWLLGARIGRDKVKNRGEWQARYSYRRLERDAWPEFLPDSDFFFGATNVKGSELDLAYGIAKNVFLSMDYYFDAKFIGTDVEQDLIQLDLNLKW